jgi:hypothetical protein
VSSIYYLCLHISFLINSLTHLSLSLYIKHPLSLGKCGAYIGFERNSEILLLLLQETMAGDLLPFLAIVLLQVGYAGMNITSMFAMQSGMHPLVLVAYRLMFATMAIAPFAYFMEW